MDNEELVTRNNNVRSDSYWSLTAQMDTRQGDALYLVQLQGDGVPWPVSSWSGD